MNLNIYKIRKETQDNTESEEMLTVSRKQIDALQGEIFKAIMDAHDADDWQDAAHYILDVMPRSFAALFGSKCLPDAHEDNFTRTEPKPSEPKFKIGDELALDKRIVVKVDEVFADGKYLVCSRIGNIYMVKESDLKPYTEPVGTKDDTKGNTKDPTFTDDCKSQCKSPDRLRIAAMAMQAIISRSNEYNPQAKAMTALEYADALIDECEKGESK